MPGTRAWPRRDTIVDQTVWMRFDWGERFSVRGGMGRNLVLQANRGARQETLKRMGNKNSHGNLMTIRFVLQNPIKLETFIQRWEECLRKL